MNSNYSIMINKISFINSWKNCAVFLLLLSCISYNTKAQSFQMVGKVTGILTLNPSGLTLENKAFSTNKNPDKETNYKIIAAPSKVEDCPNKEKLVGLCSSIFMRKEDDDPNSPYVYKYQRKIIEASCADMEKDSEAEVSRKVNIMWNKYENDLTCTDTSFEVYEGNILKLAVSRRLESVLQDAAQVWKVNLNRIDPHDQMTVLDYIQKGINTYKNTDNEPTLQQYYTLLRKAGAKHASELKK